MKTMATDPNRHSEQVTVYESEPAIRHPWRMLMEMARDLWASRELAWQLIFRDIRAQYRQTALGILWAFIIPAANASVWLFLNATGVVSLRPTPIPYPVFVISGTLLWAIFMEAVNAPLQQTSAARPMLAKINFPREALLLSGIGQASFNAAIKLMVLLAALYLSGMTLHLSLLVLPLVAFSLILMGTAAGLALVPIGMLYNDVGRGLPLLLQFMMYLCPVVYAIPKAGAAQLMMQWNPVTPLFVLARANIGGAWTLESSSLLWVMPLTLVALGIGWFLYRIAMPIMIERMSA